MEEVRKHTSTHIHDEQGVSSATEKIIDAPQFGGKNSSRYVVRVVPRKQARALHHCKSLLICHRTPHRRHLRGGVINLAWPCDGKHLAVASIWCYLGERFLVHLHAQRTWQYVWGATGFCGPFSTSPETRTCKLRCTARPFAPCLCRRSYEVSLRISITIAVIRSSRLRSSARRWRRECGSSWNTRRSPRHVHDSA